MQQLTRVPIFITVVEEQGFTAAARKLGITSSAVSKQVQNLEDELQTKLLNRSTRHMSLTEEGAIYFERAKQAIEDLNAARDEVNEMKSSLRGALRVSLPHGLAATFLAKHVAEFATMHADVSMDVSLDDRFVDPVADGFDMVVRIGTLKDSSFVARKLAACPFVLCASREYLNRKGVPQTPEELAGHSVLMYTRNSGVHEWRFKGPDGQVGHVSLAGHFKADSGDMLCQAALSGVGIVILPIFYVADHLEAGRLTRLLPQHSTWPERDIHAVFRPNRFQSARQRAFLDHLVAACRKLPWAV